MAVYKSLVQKIPIPAENKIKQKDYLPQGQFPVIDQGHIVIGGYTDNSQKLLVCDYPVIVFGDHTKCVKFISFSFAAGADGIKVLRPKDGIIGKYLFYGTQYLTYRIEDKGYARHYQYIEKQDLRVPTFCEQERIVAYIEELFSKLDNVVNTLHTIKQQLPVYRQAVLKEAFEETASWPECEFGQLMDVVRNGYGQKPDDKGVYRILTIGSVRSMYLNLCDFRLNETPFRNDDLVEENDLLFTRYNGSKDFVGVCAVVPKLNNQYAYPDKLIKFRPHIKDISYSKYLSYYSSHGSARNYLRSKIKTTSGQNGIAGSDIKKMRIRVSDNMDKVRSIVAQIESRLSVCDSIEQTINTTLAQAEAMRQSILKQAFEGGL